MQSLLESLQTKRKYNELLTEYTMELKNRSDKSMIARFSELRKFSMDIIEKSDIFYIREATEMLLPKFLDTVDKLGVVSEINNRPIFHNRWIIPIKTEDGLVENLVGYTNEANERYIYGTAAYYRRRDTLYGLENIHKAYKLGYAILTEGITDTIRLRDLGYENSFAICGTHKSEFIMNQLNRCKYGIIKLGDRDAPGLRAMKNWKVYKGINLYVNLDYKDVDEMCSKNPASIDILKTYISDCVNWLTQYEHRGKVCEQLQVTIL